MVKHQMECPVNYIGMVTKFCKLHITLKDKYTYDYNAKPRELKLTFMLSNAPLLLEKYVQYTHVLHTEHKYEGFKTYLHTVI